MTTINTIGDLQAQQGFFKNARLGVGAIEYRHIAAHIALGNPVLNAFANKPRFVLLVKTSVQRQHLAVFAIGPQGFTQPVSVLADNTIGSFENGRRGAVILLQPHRCYGFKVVGVVLNIFNLGTAPAVNRLVVVTHRRHA